MAGGCRPPLQSPVPSCRWGLGILWTLCWETAAVGGLLGQAIWPGGGGAWRGIGLTAGLWGSAGQNSIHRPLQSFCSGANPVVPLGADEDAGAAGEPRPAGPLEHGAAQPGEGGPGASPSPAPHPAPAAPAAPAVLAVAPGAAALLSTPTVPIPGTTGPPAPVPPAAQLPLQHQLAHLQQQMQSTLTSTVHPASWPRP
ncbi:hypothetical protein KIN20_025230 [Parelaphostrongylus tenuis]|uniref:Uncharacterized protein n=1 Tax=Parelaphostrongylus tenuis TaxID=148309 RepID=A0AAD5QX69_PARTN|nr:hypothetical protein KIN20_025230 [Parelaphostrongylus tenuis]